MGFNDKLSDVIQLKLRLTIPTFITYTDHIGGINNVAMIF